MLYAIKVAQKKGTAIPLEVRSSSAAMSAWIDSNRDAAPGKRGRKTGNKRAKSTASKSTSPKSRAPKKRSKKRKADADAAVAQPTPVPQNSRTDTPLRIPYGNKQDALKLGARYRSGGWYAPPGVDLAAFSGRGWL